MLQFLLAVISAYLIGSIPTGYILGRMTKGVDIRQHGSGNVGATNALRVMGKTAGAIVLGADMVKGAVCVALLPILFYSCQLQMSLPAFRAFIAASAIAGHIWTIFLKFKGGKGVATTCGVCLVLSFVPTAAALLIFIIALKITKYVSLSSIIMAFSLPILMLLFRQPFEYILFGIILFFVISYTHRENINRLMQGKENRIGGDKSIR
ncbi:MAG: glycerol-3-phosphate 1-O-acyltransferase PlsY [Candidatus Omnitrophota bacterium]